MIVKLREMLGFRLLALFACLMVVEPLRAAGSGGTVGVEEEGGSGWELPTGPVPVQHGDEEESRPRNETQVDWETEEAGLGQGYVLLDVDSLPAAVYLDGQKLMLQSGGQLVPVSQGRHFVSLFPVEKVYLAFRNETPAAFWDRLGSVGSLKDQFGLMASYERSPIQAGTRWVSINPEDTTRVRLSHVQVRQAYRQERVGAVITLFSVTTVIGAAMIASVAAISRER